MIDLNSLGGLGMDMEISSMPLLRILQKGSAEIDPSHEKYSQKKIEDAKAGDIVFSPDGTLYKELEVYPIKQVTMYSEWQPGGGLIAHHDLTITRDPNYRPRDPKVEKSTEMLGTNQLVLTMYWAVLFKHISGKMERGIIAMSSTQISTSRNWSKLVLAFHYPDTKEFKGIMPFSFSRGYLLKSEVQRNAKGSWFGWGITPLAPLSPAKDEGKLTECVKYTKEVGLTLPQIKAESMKSLPGATTASSGDVSEISDAPF